LKSGEHGDGDMNKIRLILTSLCLVFLVVSTQSYGQLYKWVDADGNVHYGDSPPEDAKLKRITGKVSSYSSVSIEPFVFDPNNIQSNRSKTVVMYSTSWCGYCKKAARHFRKKNIPFTEHDIEKSASAAREYKKLNGRGVPIILIGKQRMNGFSAKFFDKIYYGKS
jgi:glutaredoxin